MIKDRAILFLFVGLLIGILLTPFVSGSDLFVIPSHWIHDTGNNVISPANDSVNVSMNNNSLIWVNGSQLVGVGLAWNGATMRFDVTGGGEGGGDPWFNASAAYHVTSALMANWNESFGWGNHSLAGYLTSTFWNRYGTVLSPANDEDDIDINGTGTFDNVTIESFTSPGFVTTNSSGNLSRNYTIASAEVIYDSTETLEQILDDIINRGVLDVITITADNGLGNPGLDISWTTGEVFDHGNTAVEDTSSANAQTTQDDNINFVYWESGTSLTLSTTAPTGNDVAVGAVFVQNGTIWRIEHKDIISIRTANISRAMADILPAVVTDGLIVSEEAGGAAFDVSMTAGVYYLRGHERQAVSSLTSPTMVRWFHDGGGNWYFDTDTEIDPDYYDSGTGLVEFTGADLNKYWRSSFFVVGTTLHWIYPTTSYLTIAQALAGGCPAKPNGLESYPRSTCVILRGSDIAFPASDSDRWVDTRPRLGVSMQGSVSDHGGLAGLNDDDHTQYLLNDGTRSGTGDFIFEKNVTVDGNITMIDNSTINATNILTVGNPGDIMLGNDTEYSMYPKFAGKMNIGTALNPFNDGWFSGKLNVDGGIDPAYFLVNVETFPSILERINREIPKDEPNKWGGLVQWSDGVSMFAYNPSSGVSEEFVWKSDYDTLVNRVERLELLLDELLK